MCNHGVGGNGLHIQMWEEVEWLECTFPAGVNVAIQLLFQRKFTHVKVSNKPVELLLIYPQTTEFQKEGGVDHTVKGRCCYYSGYQ